MRKLDNFFHLSILASLNVKYERFRSSCQIQVRSRETMDSYICLQSPHRCGDTYEGHIFHPQNIEEHGKFLPEGLYDGLYFSTQYQSLPNILFR